ncbi:sensor histidine kinase [Duganella sp. FT92W]|uniref:Sensor histidine kinase n=2 Tax=Pseudoduganella rivuli TaxID=2666085 RepID=A0A7X2IR26_9BURK|nr:sensor histidine kinase [Pseudoduganella rivuli]
MQALRGPWVPPRLGRAPYLWLVSLAFFGWKYFYVRPSALELAALVLTLAVFLPVYFASFWVYNRAVVPYILLTFALGVAWAPFNFGACTFFIFAGAMCSHFDRQAVAYASLAGILLSAAAIALLVDLPLSFLMPTLAAGTPVGIATIMDARVQRSREQLLKKQEEVEHLARIAERERISRDMHDLLGHTLSLITLKAELAARLLERDPAACRNEIRDIETSARQALAEVRSAVSGYRETGLAHELARAKAALSAAGVALDTDVALAAGAAIPAVAENVLALALREAVTNILRHADAQACVVRLAMEDGMLVLRIRDDGKADAVMPGNGLRGMRERVEHLGGWLSLSATQGMALELHLPMNKE